jgi:Holliday junction resolvasome RuvABC endonuclease subunit
MSGVIGVDFGVKRVAACRLDEYGISLDELVIKHRKGIDDDDVNIPKMCHWLQGFIVNAVPDLILVEEPVQGSQASVRTALRLAAVGGALAFAASEVGSSVQRVSNTEWKKAVTGHGNANKDQIRAWLTANHPQYAAVCDTQDSVDATCIALYARSRLG